MSEPVRSLDRISIPKPCDANWDSMVGNNQVRFCEHCNLHVTNISRMTRHDAMRLVARSRGRLCVRYVQTPGGSLLTKGSEELHHIGRRVSRIAAGAFTATLSLSSAAAQTSASSANPLGQVSTISGLVSQRPISSVLPSLEAGATFSGRIVDPNGAVVSGAVVSLANLKMQLAFIYSTADDGAFKFSLLEAGKYALSVEAPTFAKTEIREFELSANFEKTMTVELALPEIMEQVEVISVSEVQFTVQGGVSFREPKDPLVLAAFKEDLNAVKQLVFTSLDINVRDQATETTALEEAVERSNLEIVRTLIMAGARDRKNESGRTALMRLRSKATADLVRELLSAGARVNARDDSDATALMNAAYESNYEAVKELIANGAKVDLKDDDGKTALMFAADNEDARIAKLLIDSGAGVNLKDNDGKTPLMIAAEEGVAETVRLLISYGANVNDRDDEGCSALMLVAGTNNNVSLQILLNAGADLTFKNSDGKTALAIAREADQEEIVKLLESRGAPE